jgi:hypothetical protein
MNQPWHQVLRYAIIPAVNFVDWEGMSRHTEPWLPQSECLVRVEGAISGE